MVGSIRFKAADIPLTDGAVTPPRFTARFDHKSDGDLRRDFFVELDIEVDRWGRGRCLGLRVEAKDRREVSGELLRKIPVARFAQEATASAGSWITVEKENGGWRGVPLNSAERSRLASQIMAQSRDPSGKRRSLSHDHLENVAATYRHAVSEGTAPILQIADDHGVSRSAASKWVMIARQRGFLPQTTKGKARA